MTKSEWKKLKNTGKGRRLQVYERLTPVYNRILKPYKDLDYRVQIFPFLVFLILILSIKLATK